MFSKLIRVTAAALLLAICAAALSAQSKTDAKTAIADSWITTQVYAKFFADRDIKARNLTVHTDSGVVTLTGGVESSTEHDRAVAAAKSVDGVKQVVDKLSLTPAGKSARGRGASRTVAREARSSPSIEGEARSWAVSSRLGCRPSATTPRMAPRSRRCRVSRLVSIPSSTGMPASESHASRLRVARQLDGCRLSSRTTTPVTCGRPDSMSSVLTP